MLETAEYEFKDPAELNDNEILHMLTIADDLSKWAEDVYSYAQAKAINEGKSWSGFKIVEGRSKRQYVDENKIAAWFSGSREEEAYLLQKLVDAGIPVVSFAREHNSLESLFFHLTGETEQKSRNTETFGNTIG